MLYTSAIDAVRMIRNTWRRDSPRTETEVLDMLASVHLLVLDEVGVQYGTDAEQVSLFDIIDKRYRDMMPTILLTNQNKAGMKAFLGDRSFDRLREGGQWVTFDWESHRGKVAA
jgi:DNA replication protein DnaC